MAPKKAKSSKSLKRAKPLKQVKPLSTVGSATGGIGSGKVEFPPFKVQKA